MKLNLRGRLTLTVPEAGELLGLGRDAAYAAVLRGEIDCIQSGRRKVVPTHTLLRKLGWPDDLIARALGLDDPSDGACPSHGSGLSCDSGSSNGTATIGGRGHGSDVG